MPDLSRRANSLGTENAFVVLAEVNRLIREGRATAPGAAPCIGWVPLAEIRRTLATRRIRFVVERTGDIA